MTYDSYNLNGTTVVTIWESFKIERVAAEKHLTYSGANTMAGDRRLIYTDKGDRTRYRDFKAEVEQHYDGAGVA